MPRQCPDFEESGRKTYHIQSLDSNLLLLLIKTHHLPYPPLIHSLQHHHPIPSHDIGISPPRRINRQPLLHRQLRPMQLVRVNRPVRILLQSHIAPRRQRTKVVVLPARGAGILDVPRQMLLREALVLPPRLHLLMVVLGAALHEPPGGLPLGQDGAADDGLHACVSWCVVWPGVEFSAWEAVGRYNFETGASN